MNRHVLVVDEDPESVRRAVRPLEAHGYEVLRAADGADALRHVASDRPPWIVIAGESLPDMSGEDLVAAIRQEAPTPPPGIILLTARPTDLERMGISYRDEPKIYLTRPFNPMELVVFVRHLSESIEPQQEQHP